jgi:hypothetical protein
MKNLTNTIKLSIGKLIAGAAIATAFLAPAMAHARVFVSVAIAPPVIPVYAQPLAPGDGYIWTPGYWAYGDDGYYWVDGAWVEPPYEGALWTPGYWGFDDGLYAWNAGYWGPEVGYYGGINYGFGYFGVGFYGGRWDHGHFFYNAAYNHIDGNRFHNVYNDTSHGIGVHPGGQGFDTHARVDENRGSSFRGATAFDGHANVNQGTSHEGFQGSASFNQGHQQPTQPRDNFNQGNPGNFQHNAPAQARPAPSQPAPQHFSAPAGGGFHAGGGGGRR